MDSTQVSNLDIVGCKASRNIIVGSDVGWADGKSVGGSVGFAVGKSVGDKIEDDMDLVIDRDGTTVNLESNFDIKHISDDNWAVIGHSSIIFSHETGW